MTIGSPVGTYQATSFDAVTGAATALSSYHQGSVL